MACLSLREENCLSILFQISFYVIDLINFDIKYPNKLLTSDFIKLHFPTLHLTYYSLQFFQPINFCKNGKPKQKHQFKYTATIT